MRIVGTALTRAASWPVWAQWTAAIVIVAAFFLTMWNGPETVDWVRETSIGRDAGWGR